MPIAIWHERYATGIQIIDDQHKQLFKAINELNDAFQQGKSREEMASLLDFLLTYTVSHFQTEETFMEENGYPDLLRHQGEHAELTQKVQELKAKYQSPAPPSALEIAKFIGDWLAHHVSEVDMGYTAYLKAKGIK